MVSISGLEQRLVDTSSSSDQANRGASVRLERNLVARGQTDTGNLVVNIVTNDGGIVTRRLGQLAAVTNLALHVADNGSFGHLSDGQGVADIEARGDSAVHVLSGVQAFGGNEPFLVLALFVLVAKLNASQRRSSTGVVLDALDDTLDESVALRVIVLAELGSTQAGALDGLKDASGSLTLMTSGATHFC